MLYAILEGNKLHLSEICRSLKESISLKKTIDRPSRNLNSFRGRKTVIDHYIRLIKQNIKEDHAVIIVDGFDIAKPAAEKNGSSFRYTGWEYGGDGEGIPYDRSSCSF